MTEPNDPFHFDLKQVAIFASIFWVVCVVVGILFYYSLKQDHGFPPRESCPNVYETRHVNNQICRKCHSEILR